MIISITIEWKIHKHVMRQFCKDNLFHEETLCVLNN